MNGKSHFELRTIYPIIKFKSEDLRSLEELGFVKKKTFGFYLIENREESETSELR